MLLGALQLNLGQIAVAVTTSAPNNSGSFVIVDLPTFYRYIDEDDFEHITTDPIEAAANSNWYYSWPGS